MAVVLAEKKNPEPHPLAFTPAPSSFVLVLSGLVIVLGWNWWRSRSRREQTSRSELR